MQQEDQGAVCASDRRGGREGGMGGGLTFIRFNFNNVQLRFVADDDVITFHASRTGKDGVSAGGSSRNVSTALYFSITISRLPDKHLGSGEPFCSNIAPVGHTDLRNGGTVVEDYFGPLRLVRT